MFPKKMKVGRSLRDKVGIGAVPSPPQKQEEGVAANWLLNFNHNLNKAPEDKYSRRPRTGVPHARRTWLGAALVLGAQLRALWLAAAVEVHTAKEVVAVNGTNQRLKCTFSSSSPVSQQLSVSWNFQPEDLSSHEPVFYYLKEPYKPPSGRFKERVTWDGNIERNDVSIIIWNLQPSDNGTFTCQVTNWPDVYGTIGEVRLQLCRKVRGQETPPALGRV
ncbi:myelin protein zero-like protein 2 [Sylvia atricapilla]|uniref:myelin protein zero-like protein 2 n=1 Tax=Sylvia atricapilla TaxID=48155 RepID=UPI00339A83D5